LKVNKPFANIYKRNRAKGRFREAIRIHVEESSRGALLRGNRARRARDLEPKSEGQSMTAQGEAVEVDTKAMDAIENISFYEYHVFRGLKSMTKHFKECASAAVSTAPDDDMHARTVQGNNNNDTRMNIMLKDCKVN
jgi:hypothetical protein